MKISLDQVDKVKERTGVSYAEAKAALEKTNGDVLEAIILIEEENKSTTDNANNSGKTTAGNFNTAETIQEFKAYLKEIINKGNVTRIKISKDGNTLVDVPVNAGIAAGVIAVILPPVLAVVVVAAVVTKVTIEITKQDGTVEVVNKYISKAVGEVKHKASDIAEVVKEKVSDANLEGYKKYNNSKTTDNTDNNTYVYTVKFEEEEKGSK